METATSPDSQKRPFLLERIMEASARNAFLITILVIFGIAGGIWALTRTPLDAIPDISDVRKHLSAIQGGRLAAACKARVLVLIISDVTGDDPTHIGNDQNE